MNPVILRKIDSLVAEKVMGIIWDESRCRICGWEIVADGDAGCWKNNCSMRPAPIKRADSVPHYSTDIESAFLVFEWIRKQRSNVTIHVANGWGVHAWDVNVDEDGTIDDYADPIHGYGDTAPLAICEAALSIVGVLIGASE